MSDDYELNFPDQDQNKEKSILATIWSLIMRIPRKLRIVLSLFLVTFIVIFLLSALKPQAQKRQIPETVVKVEVIEATRGDYPIVVKTNGTIQADTRGNLVSQIRGEIVRVSDQFKNGGAFEAGDVLIEVDQRDYLAEVSQAASAVSQAKAALKQEQALAKQAITDWNRLGNTGNAPTLVAREPQLAAAQANMESAEARFQTAQLNLERTKITAPYTGRVIRRNAVLGQYVGVGTALAEIFATEGVEVRLPVSQEEFTQLGLDKLGADIEPFSVTLTSKVGTQEHEWQAIVTRTDSTFDLTTRQIDVIAEVVDPFGVDGSKPPLKIGQFVNATIQGQTLKDVITVPNKSLREGNYVFTSRDEKLVRTPINILWQDDQNAVIDSGVFPGDIVVTTSLNSTLAGAKVKFEVPQQAKPADIAVEEIVSTQTEPSETVAQQESSVNEAAEVTSEIDASQVEAATAELSDETVEENSDQNNESAEAALETAETAAPETMQPGQASANQPDSTEEESSEQAETNSEDAGESTTGDAPSDTVNQ